MSKIEANKFEIALHSFNFENLIINVSNVLNFRIEEKNLRFIVNLDERIPPYIIGDELRITQVLTNLLTNAVKFTPNNGTVTLNVQYLEAREKNATILFEVIDTGIGISAEQQSRLFTAFEQVESGTARKYGGTGLGLAIAKHIVELMGGTIWVESEPGLGAKFAFTIILERSEEQISLPHIDRESVEILAVDDAPEVREFFTDVMKRYGFRCDVAKSGAEALELIKRKAGRPYNIFFVDWLMPEMDGIELTRKIKETNRDQPVIIMISSAEWGKIATEGKKAGIDRFVPKPLFPGTLLNAIEECTGRKKYEDAKEDAAPQYTGRTILIAEDVEINQEIIASVLSDTGIVIDFAENGVEALRKFEAAPEKYNMILMDVQMPEMDGYTATRKIRSLPFREAKAVPIIAMTANVFREDVEACLAAGMNDHLGKPIDVAALFEKIRLYL